MTASQETGLPSRRSDSRQGFVLVVTLSLMILLTVVAVGLLTLSSVSLRSASHGAAIANARANARLALMLALNDLQKNAGPDQRVTARAEILDSNAATPEADDVRQPYWTAAWTTGPARLDTTSGTSQRETSLGAKSPTIAQKVTSAKWLVSNPAPDGPSPLNPTTYAGTTAGINPEAVVVAKGLGTAQSDIAVPLVNILGPADTTQPTGRYGYWVADEGLKAKVNLVDSTLAASSTTQLGQAHFLAPQANAIHKIDGLVTAGKDFRSNNSAEQLGKTLDYNTISLLPTSPANLNLKRFMPDITAVSRGVLADVKHGGLKKDLTAAFETTAGFNTLVGNYGYDKRTVYRNHPDLTIPYSTLLKSMTPFYEGITDGLPWAALYAYYNIYKSSMAVPSGYSTDATTTPKTDGSLTKLPYVVSPRVATFNDGVATGKYGGIVPEVMAHRTDIALDSYFADNKYKLRIRYCPQLVLYNPYNCRISALPDRFQMERRYYSFYNRITVKVNGVQVATDVLLNQTPTLVATRYMLRTKSGQCDVLEPGETRVFGLETDVQKVDGTRKDGTPISGLEQAINFDSLTSGPGLSADCAQWSYLPDYAGTTDPKEMVEVTMTPNNRLEAGAADTMIGPENKWPFRDGGQRIFNTTGPDVPFTSETWEPIAIGDLAGTPRILIGFFIRKKGLKPSHSDRFYHNGTTVVPLFHGNAPYFTPFDNLQGVAWEEFYVSPFGKPYTSVREVELFPQTASGPWETSFGDESIGAANAGPSRRVLRDVPGQPLISIGQFMHMPTMVFSVSKGGQFGFRDTGSMFIGGSLANPFIATENNLRQNDTSVWYKNYIYDDSFLANDTLFDRFFFSTVPPAGPLNGNAPQQWTDFNNANLGKDRVSAETPPLPNSRLKPVDRNGVAPLVNDLRDFDRAAANMMLDGAFNVNSTSINAWKALLSSLSGNDLRVFKAAAGSAGDISSTTLKNPIPRFWSSSNTGDVNGAWDGNRALSDSEIAGLATRIVEQVKIRGPFLSMADFLNRRLGSVSELTSLAGCLQAAIDNTSPDINQNVKASGREVTFDPLNLSGMTLNASPTKESIPPVRLENLKDGAGHKLNSAVGMPGYLMQQDIVQAFSPAMTVRSDTFVIRAYGESLNASGQVQAKAWAEAVVQRVPEFIDNTADPNSEAAITSLTSTINQTLGRRFKMVGFRWLSSNEL